MMLFKKVSQSSYVYNKRINKDFGHSLSKPAYANYEQSM